GLVGPNGCGKSTLLQAVAGVLEPRAGHVMIDGASVWGGHDARKRARRQLGYVPEGADAPGFLTGGELWALCAATRGARPAVTPEVESALALDELAARTLDTMSPGQRRRACLGAALVGAPAVLVLDEPDNGLDVTRMTALVALLQAYAGAVLIASHDEIWLDRLSARRVRLQ
ncbi:MAG: ATP-binding cassette domain-containing protein, partial [Cellulomonas sp.]|nr:ATP-binding cassette domain-containing protein [Cellulomonas sp.]